MKKHACGLLATAFISAIALASSVHAQTFPPPVSFDSAPGTAVFRRGEVGVAPFVDVVKDLTTRPNIQGGSWYYSG